MKRVCLDYLYTNLTSKFLTNVSKITLGNYSITVHFLFSVYYSIYFLYANVFSVFCTQSPDLINNLFLYYASIAIHKGLRRSGSAKPSLADAEVL